MVFGFDDDIQASCISSTHLPAQPSGFYQKMIILSSIVKFPIQITLATRAPAYKPGEGGRLAKLYSTGRPYYGPKKKVRTSYGPKKNTTTTTIIIIIIIIIMIHDFRLSATRLHQPSGHQC